MTTKIITSNDPDHNPTFDNTHIAWDYRATEDNYGDLSTELVQTVWTHINGSHKTQMSFYGATSEEIQQMADMLADLAKRVKEYEDAFNLVNS